MDHFPEYSIPILGLRDGHYSYFYQLDSSFFARFEDTPITDATLAVQVQLDKRSSMLIFSMQLEGSVASICDRCTAPIQLPLTNQMELIVKHNSEIESDEDDEVVFIHPNTSHFNLAQYLYEFAVISLPFVNTYDCEATTPKPCNTEILSKLSQYDDVEQDNPVWEALKGLKSEK